jgi:hypothetical protein
MTLNLFTTNLITAQLQNLVACHKYRVLYTLHYADRSLPAYLDKNTFDFTATSSTQNAFVVLYKDANIKAIILEIKVIDLDDDNIIAYSNFITCNNFNGCTPTPAG